MDSLLDASILESRTAKKIIEHAHPLMAQRVMLDSSVGHKRTSSSSIDPVWSTSQSVYQYESVIPEVNSIPFP